MSSELIRLVEGIARDKQIDPESVIADLEAAMASAARKQFAEAEEVEVSIDRQTGEISAFLDGEAIDIHKLGRIPAQTAKQVMIQKLREDERGSIYSEYQDRIGEIVSGTAARIEGGTTIVSVGRAEAILPRSEQIPGESHHPGERVRAVIYEVKEASSQVRIILSRTHPEFIRRLFEQEVPEVSESIIEIKALAREAGYRTKVAVSSIDARVDAVGACVGVRGSRIKNIVDELSGEKIDIVRWNESSQVFIGNALRPAEAHEIALCFELKRATVVVSEDQLSLAIGKRGQNVRLAARLTNWDVDILTPTEYAKGIEAIIKCLRTIEKVDDTLIDKIMALGIVSLLDFEDVGSGPLIESLQIEESLALEIIKKTGEEALAQAVIKEQQKSAAQVALTEELGESTEAQEDSTKAQEDSTEAQEDSTEAQEDSAEAQEDMVQEQEPPEQPEGIDDAKVDKLDESDDQAEPEALEDDKELSK